LSKRAIEILLVLPFLAASAMAQTEGSPSKLAPPAAVGEGERVPDLATRITMDLKGVDILDVLKILSKRTGMNIVAGRNVQGSVTLFLQDVDVKNALKKILQTANLAYLEEEGIIRVITEKDYEELFGKPFYDYRETRVFQLSYAKASEVSEILNQIKSNIGRVTIDERTNTVIVFDTRKVLGEVATTIEKMDLPTVSKVYTLRYSLVEDIEPKLKTIVNPVTGSFEIDKRSNKIYVRDLPDRVQQVEDIVRGFDVQPPQVLIDAKVVEVVLNDQYRFGINWNFLFDRDEDTPYKFATPLTVSSPSSGPLSGVTFATLTAGDTSSASGDDLNGVISYLEGMGKTNTLSSPRLTVMNNQEAKLAVATREPFVSQTVVQGDSTATTADNVQFVDVGVTLTVKPTITDDNHVMIKIKPAVSTAGTPLELQGVSSGSNTTFVRTRVPVVTTQEVETTVIVKSGTTIVMGGLIQDKIDKTVRKFPWLGDLPFIGAPFRSQSEDAKKTEMVVFLTPYILSPAEPTQEPARLLNRQGELRPFDNVADVDFTDAYRYSRNPIKRDGKPYWEEAAERKAGKKKPSELAAPKQPVSEPENLPEASAPESAPLPVPFSREIEPLPEEKTESSSRETLKEKAEKIRSLLIRAGDEPKGETQIPSEPAAAPETSFNSFVPEDQSAVIFQEIQDHLSPTDPMQVTWRSYFQRLKDEIAVALKQNPTLAQLHGDVRLEFTINDRGVMQDLRVLDTKQVHGAGQKMLIAEVLAKRSAYPALPAEFGKAKRVQLTVRL
jgi:type II secretory pathway component GspD/PulD (secretin)/outer membrane biosynthesis protein TonB